MTSSAGVFAHAACSIRTTASGERTLARHIVHRLVERTARRGLRQLEQIEQELLVGKRGVLAIVASAFAALVPSDPGRQPTRLATISRIASRPLAVPKSSTSPV